MFCLHCGTENSPDSKFCKECGGRVSEREPAIASSRTRLAPQIAEELGASDYASPQMQRLLEMAFWHNQTGNIPAAILSCEAALIIDPNSTTALSLLGCLYERNGDIDKATYAFERVVEINPESQADQEKLAALKRGEFLKPVPQPMHYQWLPPALVGAMRGNQQARLGLASGVAFLVLVIGIALLRPYFSQKPSSSSVAMSAPVVQRTQKTSDLLIAAAPKQQSIISTIQAINRPIATQTTSLSSSPAPAPVKSEPRGTAGRHAASTLPASVAADANPSVPYTSAVKPLPAVQDSSQPAVRVARESGMPQHFVVVGDAGGSAESNPGSSGYPVSDGMQQADPPPPASHVYVHVHDSGAGGAAQINPVPSSSSDSGFGSAGASQHSHGALLQSQALKLQQQGDFKNAERAYNSAIAAYKQEIARGESADQARRGISACEIGLQICQQSQ